MISWWIMIYSCIFEVVIITGLYLIFCLSNLISFLLINWLFALIVDCWLLRGERGAKQRKDPRTKHSNIVWLKKIEKRRKEAKQRQRKSRCKTVPAQYCRHPNGIHATWKQIKMMREEKISKTKLFSSSQFFINQF